MNTLLKVGGFSVALTLVFTLFANMLPQVEGEPPAETAVTVGSLTMESFTALGEELFKGKGTCTLCHNTMGRAPDILALDMVATAAERLKDPRYQGQSKDVESYLRESLREPSAYVVKGYGKKGTDDAESPMPDVTKPPIELSDVEIEAVIAFMQVKDGHPVTVSLPAEAPSPPSTKTQTAAATLPASADTAQAALAKYACGACHTLLGSQSPVGPSLNDVGARLTPEQIRQSIVDPNAAIAEGFAADIMPKDFADKMTARELELIVRFLAEQKG